MKDDLQIATADAAPTAPIRAWLLVFGLLLTALAGGCRIALPPAGSSDPADTLPQALLSIVKVVPARDATDVDPGALIAVEFSKHIRFPDSQTAITMEPMPAGLNLTLSYDESTRTLTIEPHPYLEAETRYTVTLSMEVTGSDGSVMADPTEWSFRTGILPAGDITIGTGSGWVNRTREIQLTVVHNPRARCYRASSLADAYGGFADAAGGWCALPDCPTGSGSFSLEEARQDGEQRVFFQFLDDHDPDTPRLSSVKSATVVLDRVPPVISSGGTLSVNKAMSDGTLPLPIPDVSASDEASGIDSSSYRWTASDPAVEFSDATARLPSVKVSGQDTPPPGYNITVTVRDRAGNTSAGATLHVIKDTVPPGVPTKGKGTVITPTIGARWAWQSVEDGGTYDIKLDCLTKDSLPPDSAEIFPVLRMGTTVTFYQYEAGSLPDGEYQLTVVQRDTAGNPSVPFSFAPFIMAPVDPPNGDTMPYVTTLKWRDFDPPVGPDDRYTVCIAAGQPGGYARYPVPSNSLRRSDDFALSPHTQYFWYIEGPTGTRLPQSGRYTFTTGEK